ncbi:calcium-binding protein [uncultured Tateyamaria sp.]|uniref:calcium-binding protein n=1 Tax=uncultured Tateyamaria sp. TaxID=455651 RepID=UPI002612C2CD|nr:calcium-binding protein [uncultured Tateyamaria sp.]
MIFKKRKLCLCDVTNKVTLGAFFYLDYFLRTIILFEQDIADRAQALEGVTFGPYELLFGIFEGLEAFPEINVAQVYRDIEILHATGQSVDALNARLEALRPNLSQTDEDALSNALSEAFAPVQTALDDTASFGDNALRTGAGAAAYVNNFFEGAVSAFAGITGISTAVDLTLFAANTIGDLLVEGDPIDTVLCEALTEFVTGGINLASNILSGALSVDASYRLFEDALNRLMDALDILDGGLGDLEQKLTQEVPQITGLAALAEVALQALNLFRNFEDAEALVSARELAEAPQANDFFDAADKLILINRAEAIDDLVFAFGKFAPASVGPLKAAVTALVDNFRENFSVQPFIALDEMRDSFGEVANVYLSYCQQADALTTAYAENSGHLTTEGNDTIYGDDDGEFIRLGGGNDVAFGGGGNDDLRGEEGQDDLRGEGGNDNLFGGPGWDSLYGGNNDDDLRGEAGNDLLRGEADNDTLYGGSGEDQLFGDGGNDSLIGEADNDTLDGGDGSSDVAVYQRTFAGNYTITELGHGRYEVTALNTDEGSDTLVRVELLTFGAETGTVEHWMEIQTSTVDPEIDPGSDINAGRAKDGAVYLSTSTGGLYAWHTNSGFLEYLGDTSVVLADIAVAPDGVLYGIDSDYLFRIDADTAEVSVVGELSVDGSHWPGAEGFLNAFGFDIAADGTALISADSFIFGDCIFDKPNLLGNARILV